MDPKNKEFLKLQAKWYKKLKDTGFEDIEQDEDNLKEWAINLFRNKFNQTTFTAKEEYYRLAGQFLNEYPFKNNKEKTMWDLHTQGYGRHEIVRRMRSKRQKTYSRQVQETLSALVKEMVNKCR